MELSARVAGPADLDAVAETIAVAFHDDPVWSFAFDDEAQRAEQFRRWWPMFVESALPHGWVWMGEHAGTVAVWTPPGLPELTHEAEARIPALLDELLGARAPLVLKGLLQFEGAHPRDAPHYYLGFVATHDNHRGHGIGERLLAQNLELIDTEHMPVYLSRATQEPRAGAPRLPSLERACGGRPSRRDDVALAQPPYGRGN